MIRGSKYAERTSVSVSKSRDDIERTLSRSGVSGFVSGWDNGSGVEWLQFKYGKIVVQLSIPIADKEDFRKSASGRHTRGDAAVEKEWEQSRRRAWRALALIVKANMEAVASGITTMERVFMPDILLPGGSTIAQHLSKQIEKAYASGDTPMLMLPGGK